MVDVCKLHVGDCVLIVSQWGDNCHQNWSGKMDKYLGTVMTVRNISKNSPEPYAQMVEDDGEGGSGFGWAWYPAAIEMVVSSQYDCKEDEFDSEIDLSSFLTGGK